MTTLTTKLCKFRHMCIDVHCIKIFKRNSLATNLQNEPETKIHPYKRMHPWKSLEQFSEDLLKNIIYNKDGLVALNKPYGIRRQSIDEDKYKLKVHVPNCVHYTVQDALPYICSQLKYSNLLIVKCPEMYMSGVTLLAVDPSVKLSIRQAYARTHFFSNTYWVVTVGVPKQLKGEYRLAWKLISNPNHNRRKAILTTTWSKGEEKFRMVKLFKAEYEVLSNSTLNLCSLINLKASTHNKHMLRLFTSTHLYCPILGDNIYASQIQKVGDTYLKIDPFLTCPALPKLDRRVLSLLNVSPSQQVIIPAHIHLRSVYLPSFHGNNLTIEAPLMAPFDWTCKQLEFKYLK